MTWTVVPWCRGRGVETGGEKTRKHAERVRVKGPGHTYDSNSMPSSTSRKTGIYCITYSGRDGHIGEGAKVRVVVVLE